MSSNSMFSMVKSVVLSVLDGEDLPRYGTRAYGLMLRFLSRFYSILAMSEYHLEAFYVGTMLDIVNDAVYKKRRYVYPRETKLLRRFLEYDFEDLAAQMSGFFNG